MARYGIATLFDNHDVGYEFSQDDIPLHLTHVDSFQIELGADDLTGVLSECLAGQSPIKVKALKDVFYGSDKDILVTEIELSPALSHMHSIIMKMLSDNNAALRNPQFHNDDYSPHVTVYGA